jgi:predicted glycoside hydrolase/deacetylase ChbG (UPF0249 family)
MDVTRALVVVADDYGIGPATSRRILELAAADRLSASVLLVNSPHAVESVRHWHAAGGNRCLEMGWHACLTMDRPLRPAREVSSLVRDDGTFCTLAQLLGRLALGKVVPGQVHAELSAQYDRFCQLTGQAPAIVNGHHHIHVFPGIAPILLDLLACQEPRPYVRRVNETFAMFRAVKQARLKRLFLATLGRRCMPALKRLGYPGNDSLAGVGDPQGLTQTNLVRWLAVAPGPVLELMCHPGSAEEALTRDTQCGGRLPGLMAACDMGGREREYRLLAGGSVDELCRSTAGLRFVRNLNRVLPEVEYGHGHKQAAG